MILIKSNVPIVILNEETLENLVHSFEKKVSPDELSKYRAKEKKIEEFFEFGCEEPDLRERIFFLRNILVD